MHEMPKELRYRTTFASIIRCPTDEERDTHLSKASLKSLKPFLPTDIDLDENYDLLPFSANAYVINFANLNGDVVDMSTTLTFHKHFKYKRVDVEHKLSQGVGLISSYGYSEFSHDYALGVGSAPLVEDKIKELASPINAVVAGYIWKVGNKELVKALQESNDPSSPYYMSISLSFEIAYDEFDICMGKNRNLEECEMVTDTKDQETLLPYLIANGGTGKYQDKFIFRKLIGEIMPIGVALTVNPAASVKGVLIPINDKSNTNAASINKNSVIIPRSEKDKLTNPLKSSVKGYSMKLRSIEDVKDLSQEDLKDVAVANLNTVIQSWVKEGNETWEKKLHASEKAFEDMKTAKADFEQKFTALDEQFKDLDKKFKSISSELETVKTAGEKQERESRAQTRIEYLTNKYELNDKQRVAVAKQIVDLDDDSFKKWEDEDFAVFATVKTAKTENKIEDKKVAKASVEDEEAKKTAEAALKNAKPEGTLPNGTGGEDTIEAQHAKAFSEENLTIS